MDQFNWKVHVAAVPKQITKIDKIVACEGFSIFDNTPMIMMTTGVNAFNILQ